MTTLNGLHVISFPYPKVSHIILETRTFHYSISFASFGAEAMCKKAIFRLDKLFSVHGTTNPPWSMGNAISKFNLNLQLTL